MKAKPYTCRHCGRDAHHINGHLERVNMGIVPAIWQCSPSCDAPPSTPEERVLGAILSNGEGGVERSGVLARSGDKVRSDGSPSLPTSPFGAGWQLADSVANESTRSALLETAGRLTRNLYLAHDARNFLKGVIANLAEREEGESVPVPCPAEPNTNNENTDTTMKEQINAATTAFGTLLTAVVALFVLALKEAGVSSGKTALAPVPDAPSDDDLLGGGDEPEPEPEVTMQTLRELGQAAIKAGKADKMKAVLKKFGSENLGGLDKANYSKVAEALAKLGK